MNVLQLSEGAKIDRISHSFFQLAELDSQRDSEENFIHFHAILSYDKDVVII